MELKCGMTEVKGNKKRAVLHGSLYFTGTEALGADMELAGLPSAYVDSDALNVDEPAASCMAVRMAHRVSRGRSSHRILTFVSPLVSLKQSTSTLYHSNTESGNITRQIKEIKESVLYEFR